MNALELTDWIENGAPFGKYETAKQAVVMLRQKQAEIEKINAEWVQAAMALGKCVQENHELKAEIEALKAKTLTEPSVKEITDLWLDVINNIPANDKRPTEWHFANAILRKAQEK